MNGGLVITSLAKRGQSLPVENFSDFNDSFCFTGALLLGKWVSFSLYVKFKYSNFWNLKKVTIGFLEITVHKQQCSFASSNHSYSCLTNIQESK